MVIVLLVVPNQYPQDFSGFGGQPWFAMSVLNKVQKFNQFYNDCVRNLSQMMMISFSTKQWTNIMERSGTDDKKSLDRWSFGQKQLMTSGCGGCYVTQAIHVVFVTPWNLSKTSTTSTPRCPFHIVQRNTVDFTSSNSIMLRAITCVQHHGHQPTPDCVLEQLEVFPSQLVTSTTKCWSY